MTEVRRHPRRAGVRRPRPRLRRAGRRRPGSDARRRAVRAAPEDDRRGHRRQVRTGSRSTTTTAAPVPADRQRGPGGVLRVRHPGGPGAVPTEVRVWYRDLGDLKRAIDYQQALRRRDDAERRRATWHDLAPWRRARSTGCWSRGRTSVRARGSPRSRSKRWHIAQCAVAAGVAWFIAADVLGHHDPVLRADRGGGQPRHVLRPAAAPGGRGDPRRRDRGAGRRPAGGAGSGSGLVAADADRGAGDERPRSCSTAASCS